MGHVIHEVEITGEKTVKVRMLVDTGATYSVIPEDLARALGVQRKRRVMPVTYADGRRARLDAGMVVFRVSGREVAGTVLIGKVPEPILGVETLEVLGLTVDPAQGKLRPKRSWTVRV